MFQPFITNFKSLFSNHFYTTVSATHERNVNFGGVLTIIITLSMIFVAMSTVTVTRYAHSFEQNKN